MQCPVSHVASDLKLDGGKAWEHGWVSTYAHAHTQEIADARRIRNQILTNFELATQPGISEQERRRLLHFVIVGGGPTGVEFGAEFYDFFQQVQLSLIPGPSRRGEAESLESLAQIHEFIIRTLVSFTVSNFMVCANLKFVQFGILP